MAASFRTRLGWARRLRNSDPHPIQVRPYGPYGGGLLTGHPIGLLIIAAVTVIVWKLPEARWFLLATVAFGALIGLVLWYSRNR